MMPRFLPLLVFAILTLTAAAQPLRVVISSDSDQFSRDLAAQLAKRGVNTTTATALHPAALDGADVLVLYAKEAKPRTAGDRAALEAFAKRGGGLVVLHGAIATGAADWWKPLVGGAWAAGKSRKFASRMMLYLPVEHPIVRESSPFDIDDETLYDLDIDPVVQVLASAFTPKVIIGRQTERSKSAQEQLEKANIYDLQPQMWTYETPGSAGSKGHRAFVALQGAEATLRHTSFKTCILRGIAWAARRENVDELCTAEDLATLRYPVGGPRRAEDTVKALQLHPGFRVSVVAAEPLISKPIAVQWDARGRLWVAETPEYPNGRRPHVAEPWKETGPLKPGNYDRPATDRISILEDTDGDGVMDRKEVFYEGLELVTGFCLHRDGFIAIHQPDIVFVRDTDGDGRGDRTEPIFTGFTPGDTHFVANHLIPAPDGWIYVSMGGDANVRKPGGKDLIARVTSGVFRFKADGSAIEQYSSKGGNGFGLDVTSDGEIFFGQATSGNPVQHVVLPERLLERGKVGTKGGAKSVIEGRKVAVPKLPERAPLRQIDVVGGYSSACASTVYEGGAWPAEFEGSIFCTEPILNIVHRETLRPVGPSYAGEMNPPDSEFIFSEDYWFRPFAVAPGPDGALYLVDFYTPVVAHSDSRGPLHTKSGASVRPDRDHYFGRIYRLTHEKARTLEVPDLSRAEVPALIKALAHPNRTVRFTAHRLLMERGGPDLAPALLVPATGEGFAPARILALWGLHRLNALPADLLRKALTDAHPSIRKSAALIAEAAAADTAQVELTAGLNDADPRVRLAMLRGLASTRLTAPGAAALVAVFPKLEDDWSKSAAVAAASGNAVTVLQAALSAAQPESVQTLVAALAAGMVERRDENGFAQLIPIVAKQSATADPLKRLILEAAATLPNPVAVSAEVSGALRRLLSDGNFQIRAAALPLATTWDQATNLKADFQPVVAQLLAKLNDEAVTEPERIGMISALVSARRADGKILPAINQLLRSNAPDAVKRHAVLALGAAGDAAAGAVVIDAFEALSTPVQQLAFDAALTRPAWTVALLDALAAKQIGAGNLGPSNIFRLRTHPVKPLAERAGKLLDMLRRPNADKDAVIAKLTPLVTQPGNASRGRESYVAACAVCHQFGDLGTALGPVLTGMGAHGPSELLVHIVDPNRAVDAGYEIWNVETKDGKFQTGIVAQENDARLLLRMPGSDVEIAKDNIKTRNNTHRSLMPEGFEALGAETLRDLLTFLCADQARFRVLDLSNAFTADSRRGLYESQEQVNDTLPFKKFGLVSVEGIPFEIANPNKSALGGNVIVLKGGGDRSFAHTFAQRVEVPVKLAASKLHFLGGIAGWGAPDARTGNVIMKVTFVFADQAAETVELRDGVEFADYIGPIDVPGSKLTEGLVTGKQLRWFTVPVPRAVPLEKIILESPGRGAAPTTVGITAELVATPR